MMDVIYEAEQLTISKHLDLPCIVILLLNYFIVH